MIDLLDAKEGLGTGINLAGDPKTSVFWQYGENVNFFPGIVQAAYSQKILATVGEPIYAMQSILDGGGPKLYFGTPTRFMSFDGVNFATIVSGVTTDDWILGNWGVFPVFAYAGDQLNYWDGILVRTPASASGAGKFFFNQSPFFLKFGTDGSNIEWCSQDNLDAWVPSSSNTAGNFVIRDIDSDLMAAAQLYNAIGIYSQNAMYICRYIGGDFVYSVVPALQGIGAVSKRAVVSDGRMNYGLSQRGFWISDGAQKDYILTEEVEQFLRKYLNRNALEQVRGYHDSRTMTIWWQLPTENSLVANRSIGFNYKQNNWLISSFVPSAVSADGIFTTPILAFDGSLYSDWADAQNSYVQSKPLDCGKPLHYKRFQAIRLQFIGVATIDVGVSDTIDGTIEWIHSQPLESLVHFTDREGVYLHLKISGAEFWRVDQLQVVGELTGSVI